MISRVTSRLLWLTCLAGLCAAAAVGVAAPAHAANANAVLTLTAAPVDPADQKARASLSRNATGSEPAVDFRAAYQVSIYNPTNSSKNFRFVGNITVPVGQDGLTTPPTQFASSRGDCAQTGSNPVQIVCPKLEVAKGKTIVFSFEFRTPTSGASMNLGASLFFPASNGTLTASGTSSIELVKLLYVDYTLGFNTFVSKAGGTFHSGDPSSLAGSPGGVATATDPFTTTIIVPSIPFTTSALVEEKQKGELTGCSTLFVRDGCFSSNVTIPSAPSALKGMVIYLRIDRSKRATTNGTVFDVAIRYSTDGESFVTVRDCSATVSASSGQPCIRSRKDYGFGAAEEWKYDWEFMIEAVDNGRYVNL